MDRGGDDKYSNSVIALDVLSGKLLWFFQAIQHDLWDLDVPAAPNLVAVMHDGRRVDAVAQVTKQGNTLLLDRLTGRPLFPFRMRRAPVSSMPGEVTASYQSAPELPEPFSRQVFTRDDATNISAEAHAAALKAIDAARYGWFTPVEIDRPTIYYGIHGGAEWPGASFDPTTGLLYVSTNEIPWIIQLAKLDEAALRAMADQGSPGAVVYQGNCATCHGDQRQGQGMAPSLIGLKERLNDTQVGEILKNGRQAMPSFASVLSDEQGKAVIAYLLDKDDAPLVREYVQSIQDLPSDAPERRYTFKGFNKFEDAQGFPAGKPPWGTLCAINLNTGALAWKVPLGEYEELTHLGIPKTGTENFGGTMVTAGGLVFAAGTRDLMIRAFDKDNGKELWRYKLPFGGFAPPATYEVNGRQFIVIAATGGGKLGGEMGDAYIAFALAK